MERALQETVELHTISTPTEGTPTEVAFELLSFDDMRVEREGWQKVDVTVDSGAAHSVANGDAWPKVSRQEPEGSRNGSVYLGPGKERIPNRGEGRSR